MGVDACPSFGQKLITEGVLTASVLTPANTGLALGHLHRFWTKRHADAAAIVHGGAALAAVERSRPEPRLRGLCVARRRGGRIASFPR